MQVKPEMNLEGEQDLGGNPKEKGITNEEVKPGVCV